MKNATIEELEEFLLALSKDDFIENLYDLFDDIEAYQKGFALNKNLKDIPREVRSNLDKAFENFKREILTANEILMKE